MPYEIISRTIKGKKKWFVRNKDTGELKNKEPHDTYEQAVSHQRALYHAESGGKFTKRKT